MDTLAFLLGPSIGPEDFFRSYWLQAPLHVPNSDPHHWDSLFNVEDDVEPMWRRAGASTTDLLYFQNCKGTKEGAIPQSTKLPSPFYAFANRFSVVLNRADHYSPAIRTLCEALARPAATGLAVVEGGVTHFPFAFCNVYLTPPHSQTVPRHSDDRDVLLLQVMGEKEWVVYRDTATPSGMPVWLPYRSEEVGKAEGRPAPSTLEPTLRVTVRQGDVLYLPRGFVHEAATSDASSLHLTVALQSSDWDLASAVGRSVTEALRNHPALVPLTRPPRMGELAGSIPIDELVANVLKGVSEVVGGSSVKSDFANHMASIEAARRDGHPLPPASPQCLVVHPLCGGPAPYSRHLPGVLPISPSTQLVWTSHIEVLDVEESDAAVAVPLVVTFGDTLHKRSMQLAVSEEMAGVVMFLSKRGPFPVEVSELPCLAGKDCPLGLFLRQLCAAEVLLQSAVVHRLRN